MPMQRYKLTIAYRGTRYHGWQFQPAAKTWKGPLPPPERGIPTVSEHVKRAIKHVVRHPVDLVGSSRTDAGVHAKGQVAHFDTDQLQIPPDGMRRAINHRLPPDIIVHSLEPVPSTFSARGSTVGKRYQYSIWHAPDRVPFMCDLAWHRWQHLHIAGMREAAQHFVGEHDFESFARPGHRRESTIRTIYACDVSYRPPRLIIGIEGGGFLWNMVRIMVGTLVEVGLRKFNAAQIPEMLEARDRKSSGSTAPAHGLYLQWIKHEIWEPNVVDPE
jgi:tRNA pseudouridine38-40 synthase